LNKVSESSLNQDSKKFMVANIPKPDLGLRAKFIPQKSRPHLTDYMCRHNCKAKNICPFCELTEVKMVNRILIQFTFYTQIQSPILVKAYKHRKLILDL
jgi:hypothetical protein